jgi:glycosyltransferase involved in cell wall biosynthesis
MTDRDKVAVLLVGNYLPSSAGSRSISEDLGLHLSEAGWPVRLTSRRVNRVRRLADMLATTWSERNRYDAAIVDVYSGPAFLWGEAVCRLLRAMDKPYVLTLHGGNLPVYAGSQTARVRRHLAAATAVTVPSPYLLERMKPYRYGLRLLPNPLELSAYRFRQREHVGPRLLWLRAFHKIYNPALAPKVVAQLRDFPGIELLMAGPDKGDGSLEQARQTARDLGVADRVQFHGSVPKSEVPQWLEQGDIFLNTTGVDNTPVTVLEAMACGLCVVSTNVGGIPYLLRHEHDALLVPAGDAAAMASAVRRLLTGRMAGRLSANGRSKVEDFDWGRVLPEWQDLLRSITGRGSRAHAMVS